jgi:hypothetical protein
LALVFLNRRVLPEVLTLVLHPRRRRGIGSAIRLQSPLGWTHLEAGWRTVELWKVPAEELLDTEDAGVVPWVPLCRFSGAPEPVLERCRAIVDQWARSDERSTLLAVTQVLAKLRNNDPQLLAILGGREVMIESPLIRELMAETRQEDIRTLLETRFGSVPAETTAALGKVQDRERLRRLLVAVHQAADLDGFHARLDG